MRFTALLGEYEGDLISMSAPLVPAFTPFSDEDATLSATGSCAAPKESPTSLGGQRLQMVARSTADLERLFDFIAAEHPQKAREQILSVRKAFELLADQPLLGRPAEEGRRELILSRGRYGYIAKYRWLPAEEIILILAVRHQLEAGYAGE